MKNKKSLAINSYLILIVEFALLPNDITNLIQVILLKYQVWIPMLIDHTGIYFINYQKYTYNPHIQ